MALARQVDRRMWSASSSLQAISQRGRQLGERIALGLGEAGLFGLAEHGEQENGKRIASVIGDDTVAAGLAGARLFHTQFSPAATAGHDRADLRIGSDYRDDRHALLVRHADVFSCGYIGSGLDHRMHRRSCTALP